MASTARANNNVTLTELHPSKTFHCANHVKALLNKHFKMLLQSKQFDCILLILKISHTGLRMKIFKTAHLQVDVALQAFRLGLSFASTSAVLGCCVDNALTHQRVHRQIPGGQAEPCAPLDVQLAFCSESLDIDSAST